MWTASGPSGEGGGELLLVPLPVVGRDGGGGHVEAARVHQEDFGDDALGGGHPFAQEVGGGRVEDARDERAVVGADLSAPGLVEVVDFGLRIGGGGGVLGHDRLGQPRVGGPGADVAVEVGFDRGQEVVGEGRRRGEQGGEGEGQAHGVPPPNGIRKSGATLRTIPFPTLKPQARAQSFSPPR